MGTSTFFRFALVGCINYFVSFVVFILCYRYLPLFDLAEMLHALLGSKVIGTELGPLPDVPLGAVANVIAYLAGMGNSFVLNKFWTFKRHGNTVEQMIKFVIVNIVTLTLSTLSIYMLVDRLKYPQYTVWLTITGSLLVLNYMGSRYWAFARISTDFMRHKTASPP
jgi:putative flippase GtrA